MTKTKFLSVMALLSAAGCDTAPKPEPYEGVGTLDSPYAVKIDWISTTCGEIGSSKTSRGLVDLFVRSDGLLNLYPITDVPMPIAYLGLAQQSDGTYGVSFTANSSSGSEFPQRASGILTPSSMDLTIVATEPSLGAENGVCSRTVRLQGAPIHIHDPAALDGIHRVTSVITNGWCPDGSDQGDPPQNLRLTLGQTDGGTSMISFAGFSAAIPMSRKGGTVKWKGKGVAGGAFGPVEVDAQIDGSVNAIGDDLTFFLPSPLFVGCGSRATATGTRRQTSYSSVDNDYRIAYEWTDTCRGPGGPTEYPVSLMTQPDGSTLIHDGVIGSGPTTVRLSPEGYFEEHSGSEDDGLIVTYKGRVAPPVIAYGITARYVNDYGSWCDFSLTANGVARYLSPDEQPTTSAIRVAPEVPAPHPVLGQDRPWNISRKHR